MLKFFSEAAAITYLPDTSIVHVVFNDLDDQDACAEILQVAEGIAQVHHSVAYLVEKTAFDHLNIQTFGRLSLQWMDRLEARSTTDQSVALLVSPSAFSSLLDYYRDYKTTCYQHVIYNAFASGSKGIDFLQATND